MNDQSPYRIDYAIICSHKLFYFPQITIEFICVLVYLILYFPLKKSIKTFPIIVFRKVYALFQISFSTEYVYFVIFYDIKSLFRGKNQF